MRLLNIEAINYKMHKKFSLKLDPEKNYVLSGSNKVGKTTFANMILWNLTGKDIDGRSNFDIRNHAISPENEVRVNCTYSYDEKTIDEFDEPVTKTRTVLLTRKLVAKFSGSGTDKKYNGDLTAYEIDGVDCTADQYDEMVYRLFNADYETIRNLFNIKDGKTKYDLSILLNIREFMYRLSNKEQRHILTSLFSKITPIDVVKAFGDKYNDIKQYILDGVDLLEIQRQKNGQISELNIEIGKNEKKGEIQTRIDERQKDIIETDIDIDSCINIRNSIEEKINDLQKEIIKIENNAQLSGLNNKLDELKNKLNALKHENNIFREKQLKDKTSQNLEQIDNIRENIAELERINKQNSSELSFIEESLSKEAFKLQNAQKEYNAVAALKWDINKEICPTCKQTLPQEKIMQLRADFNFKRAEDLSRFESIIENCRKSIIDLQNKKAVIIGDGNKTSNNEERIKVYKEEINRLKEQNASVKVEDMPGYQTEYDRIIAEGKNIKQQISDLQEDKKGEIAKIKDQISDLKLQLLENQKQIDIYNRNEDAKKRIAELYKELELKTKALSEAQYISLLIDDFIADKDNMAQAEINSNFQYVEWQMYGKLKGSDKLGEKCVCMIKSDNNNTFESTNKASKINATIDIANAFAKALGCSFVLVVDDCEGIDIDNFMIKSQNQIIRLKVISRQPLLMFETDEEHEKRIEEEMNLIKEKRQKDMIKYKVNYEKNLK